MDGNVYEVEVLGNFCVRRDGRPLQLQSGCGRAIAYLAVCGDGPRSWAAGHLWPDASAQQAASNLRTALWRLEKKAPELIGVTGALLTLTAGRVDIRAARTWIHRVIASTGDGEPVPPKVLREILFGWDEPWVSDARAEFHLLRLHALEITGERMLREGWLGMACEVALAAVVLDPLRESANRLLIQVHLHGGNTVEALRAYHRFATLLQDEIGEAPTFNLRDLALSNLPSRAAVVDSRATQRPVQ